MKYYYKPADDLFSNICGTMTNVLTAFCPAELNIALLDSNNLKIINTQKDQILYTESLEKKQRKYIALSRDAHMFATIDEHRKIDNTPRRTEQIVYTISHCLTIKNIATQKVESIKIPSGFSFEHWTINVLDFKKEGTHIIVHGYDNKLGTSHMIFPVTINKLPAPSKKTLQHYFAQKMICKNIMGSTQK